MHFSKGERMWTLTCGLLAERDPTTTEHRSQHLPRRNSRLFNPESGFHAFWHDVQVEAVRSGAAEHLVIHFAVTALPVGGSATG